MTDDPIVLLAVVDPAASIVRVKQASVLRCSAARPSLLPA